MTDLHDKVAQAIATQPSFPSAFVTLNFCSIGQPIPGQGTSLSMPLGVFFNEKLCLEVLAADIPPEKMLRFLCRSGAMRDMQDALEKGDLPVYSATVNALIPVINFTPGASQFALRPLALMLNELPTTEKVEELLPLWTSDDRPSGGKIIKDREVLKVVLKKMAHGHLSMAMVGVRAALEARLNSFVLH